MRLGNTFIDSDWNTWFHEILILVFLKLTRYYNHKFIILRLTIFESFSNMQLDTVQRPSQNYLIPSQITAIDPIF